MVFGKIVKEFLLQFAKNIGIVYVGYFIAYFFIITFFRSVYIGGTDSSEKPGTVLFAVIGFIVYWIVQVILLSRQSQKSLISRPESHIEWLVRRGSYELVCCVVVIVLCVLFGTPSFSPQAGAAMFMRTFVGFMMFAVILDNLWFGGLLHLIFAGFVFAVVGGLYWKKLPK